MLIPTSYFIPPLPLPPWWPWDCFLSVLSLFFISTWTERSKWARMTLIRKTLTSAGWLAARIAWALLCLHLPLLLQGVYLRDRSWTPCDVIPYVIFTQKHLSRGFWEEFSTTHQILLKSDGLLNDKFVILYMLTKTWVPKVCCFFFKEENWNHRTISHTNVKWMSVCNAR